MQRAWYVEIFIGCLLLFRRCAVRVAPFLASTSPTAVVVGARRRRMRMRRKKKHVVRATCAARARRRRRRRRRRSRMRWCRRRKKMGAKCALSRSPFRSPSSPAKWMKLFLQMAGLAWQPGGVRLGEPRRRRRAALHCLAVCLAALQHCATHRLAAWRDGPSAEETFPVIIAAAAFRAARSRPTFSACLMLLWTLSAQIVCTIITNLLWTPQVSVALRLSK